MLIAVLALVLYILIVIAHWKIFTKAGQRGWASIIPILNLFVLVKLVKRPMWWAVVITIGLIVGGAPSDAAAVIQVVTGLIAILAAILLIITFFDLAKAFGHGIGFGLGLVFLSVIFALILGFGSSTYQLEPDPLF
ncbi:MAG: DUF5684 domain-containing protein [Actinomycetes bacterium]